MSANDQVLGRCVLELKTVRERVKKKSRAMHNVALASRSLGTWPPSGCATPGLHYAARLWSPGGHATAKASLLIPWVTALQSLSAAESLQETKTLLQKESSGPALFRQ